MTFEDGRTRADGAAEMSVRDKATLTTGRDFWHTAAVGAVPSVMVADGPHGLRKQSDGGDHLGLGASLPATCFPPAVALGSSFDPGLVYEVGRALGAEASAADVAVLLGPGANIKRSPLCGRNFEYVSEDPFVTGEIATAWVRGIQSRGVGSSLKHFAANNQETDRLRVSADVDPRALQEIYLRGFRRVVRDAQPWTVMSSYNKVNGVPATENPWLLTTTLRDEWGFDGVVVSDWFAVTDRVAAIAAGLDLAMPGDDGSSTNAVVAAVDDGRLDPNALDRAARRVAELIRKSTRHGADRDAVDVDAHHALARNAAARSIVLLKNDRAALPLTPATSVAVIGQFAQTPRYQGAGSSKITPTRLDNALDGIRVYAAGPVTYAQGFTTDAHAPHDADVFRDEAVAIAAAAEVAIVFAGLPDRLESEGYDRDDIDLPADQLAVISAVAAANPRTVVVLSNGGVVALPFVDKVPAIIEGWLLGQAGGSAVADVLYGAVNPSAKLTETIPVRLTDSPAYLDFPGEFGHVRYSEGLFVGYRWYDARDLDVAFPFGHGLSYTTFSYDSLRVSTEGESVSVTITVTNTGSVAGRDVVQVYTSLPGSTVRRAVRELKGFGAATLEPGESTDVTIRVRRDDLTYWDTRVQGWILESGDYIVEVGASSRDIRASQVITVTGEAVHVPLSRESSVGELLSHPVAGPLAMAALAPLMEANAASSDIFTDPEGAQKMVAAMPIGKLAFAPGLREQIDELIVFANSSGS